MSTQNITNVICLLLTELKFIRTSNMNPTRRMKSLCKTPNTKETGPRHQTGIKMSLSSEDATCCTDLTLPEWLPGDYALSVLVWCQFSI